MMLRNPFSGIEKFGGMATDRIKKAADGAAEAAKNTTGHMEAWAKAGYDSAHDAMRTKPFVLGAASLGFGAIMGGLYSLWQRGAAKARPARKAMPVRARAQQSLRAKTPSNGTGSAAKRKAKRTPRAPHSLDS
jgi:hypothetical protein